MNDQTLTPQEHFNQARDLWDRLNGHDPHHRFVDNPEALVAEMSAHLSAAGKELADIPDLRGQTLPQCEALVEQAITGATIRAGIRDAYIDQARHAYHNLTEGKGRVNSTLSDIRNYLQAAQADASVLDSTGQKTIDQVEQELMAAAERLLREKLGIGNTGYGRTFGHRDPDAPVKGPLDRILDQVGEAQALGRGDFTRGR